MHRVTITVDDDLMQQIDSVIAARGYQSRSEAIRDLARAGLQQDAVAVASPNCVAALVYIYDHDVRQLPQKLTNFFHDHHVLSVSTLHVHLDHGRCMEVTILRGPTAQVRAFGEHIIAERGIYYGRLFVAPMEDASTN